jgi:Cu-Zn family superoxide dismutase
MTSLRLAIAALLTLSACTTQGATTVDRAGVTMRDATGRDLGTLTLSNTTGGLILTGGLSGLPAGVHGIHVHTTGRCEPPFESAGAHWNPASRMHGTLNPQGPHLGDMPNVTVSSSGSVTLSVTTPGGTLRGTDGLMDSDGAAVVIHAQADDYRTDPSGNSGVRIACGVVRGI